jgi:hypothetical protein
MVVAVVRFENESFVAALREREGLVQALARCRGLPEDVGALLVG